jgi:glycosyltransferase involved in cell wall biosynthesis
MKKIKIFLGGFINYTNAQNLNCLALAKHLNKDKFDVFTLEYYVGNLESNKGKIPGVKIFNCFKPARLSLYLGFLWGIWNCDVAYLPKSELWKYNRLLLKIFGKKSFQTIEGILDEDNLKSAANILGGYQNVIDQKSYTDRVYPITAFLGAYNQQHHQMDLQPKVLYLGCDTENFKNGIAKSGQLKKVVYIGRLKRRKGIFDFLLIAQHFPNVAFFVFGNGEDKEEIESYLKTNSVSNVQLMGVTDHVGLAQFLKEVDLHILPSRSEGFPKVTLETAAAGVPSIVYGDYGAAEWITNDKNGWVVNNTQDMITIIEDLQHHPKKLQAISEEAIELANRFDWKQLVKDWEETIIGISGKSNYFDF